MEDADVVVKVTAGPEEDVSGVVELRVRDDGGEWEVLASETLGEEGGARFVKLLERRDHGEKEFVVAYLGNDNIRPGRTRVVGE